VSIHKHMYAYVRTCIHLNNLVQSKFPKRESSQSIPRGGRGCALYIVRYIRSSYLSVSIQRHMYAYVRTCIHLNDLAESNFPNPGGARGRALSVSYEIYLATYLYLYIDICI